MTDNQTPAPPQAAKKRKKRSCGLCGAESHDKRTCPRNEQGTAEKLQNSSLASPTPHQTQGDQSESSTKKQQPSPVPPRISLKQCLYLVLDLETTGLSRSNCHIIEIGAEILDPSGIPIEDGSYTSLVRPPTPIPQLIVELTGITQAKVEKARPFNLVMNEFFAFIDDKMKDFKQQYTSEIRNIIIVAHNGKRFDFPFILDELKRNDMLDIFAIDMLAPKQQ